MARSKRVHDVYPREIADKVLYILAFVIGVSGIIALKYYEHHLIYTALFPASVLFIYAGLAWYMASVQLEPELIGDNCYYLGFIFTLISLAWSLYGVAGSGGEADFVRDIISGFGVALTSTIVGIFLRALFIQFRPDVVTSDREARAELNTAVREFRTSLSQSVASMKDFAREVEQSLAEHNSRLEAANRASTEAHQKWLAEHAREVLKQTTEANQAAIENALEAGKAEFEAVLKGWMTSLEDGSAKLSEETTAFSERLQACLSQVEQGTQQLATSCGTASDAVSTSFKQISSSGDSVTESVSRFAGEIGKAEVSIRDGIGAPLGKILEQNRELAASFETLGQTLEERSGAVVTALETQRDRLTQTSDSIDAVVSKADRLVGSIDAALERLASGKAEDPALSVEIKSALDDLGQAINNVNNQLQRFEALLAPERGRRSLLPWR